MNVADVVVVMLMVIADICLIVHLRRRRSRYMRMDRMTKSLQLHLTGELLTGTAPAPRRRAHILQRVS